MESDKKYFITATILEWKHLLKNDRYKDFLIKEWRHRIQLNQLKLYGFVIMPNHYHAIINIPSPYDPSNIQRDIHKWVSKQIIIDMKTMQDSDLDLYRVNMADMKYQIWQRDSLPMELYSRDVQYQKLNYIHKNVLQEHWKLSEVQEGYKYSSASFYLNQDTTWDFLSHIED